MDARSSRYQEVYARWQRDPQGFWGEAAADIDWFETAEDGVRSRRRHLRPLVHRRRLQHLLQCGRPSRRCRARRADGDHLRFAARRRKAQHHLPSPDDGDAGARRHAARSRRRQGRPRHPLHADDPGGGDRHARLRAHRRHSFGRVRRLRGARTGDPHRRCQAESDSFGKLRHRARPHRAYKPLLDEAIALSSHKPRRVSRSCSARKRRPR